MTRRDPSTAPLVTISLVTWNGARWLDGCLSSLVAQDLGDYELLALDNASDDESLAHLNAHAAVEPRMSVRRTDTNLGYAAAHNRNILAARGQLVLLLNQDAELDPGFLGAAAAVFQQRPDVGSVQGRLRRLDGSGRRLDTLDTTGLVMQRDRRAISRGQGQVDGPAHARPGPVWGVDGPAPVYRRQALLDARLPRSSGGWEVLDEDFFLYKEDVDLAWRLRLLGWEAWYEPRALGWHARGTSDTGATRPLAIVRANLGNRPEVRALSWRNQRLMQIKNDTLWSCLRDLPWIARREILSSMFLVMADRDRLRTLPDLVRATPAAARKHRYIHRRVQRTRPMRVAQSAGTGVEDE
jgi:GT2 family glycosyltransferase